MNELEEYAASLPAPLNRDARIKLIEQWKIDNNWEGEKPEPVGTGTVLKSEDIVYGGEPVKEILETVKTEGDAAGARAILLDRRALVGAAARKDGAHLRWQ